MGEAREIPAGKTLSVDLCVVGAGAAGIAMAHHFAGSRTSVALLEAGETGLSRESREFYRGTASGDTDASFLTDFRLRQLGGTTNHWGGHCYPLEPIDFERREWISNSGWPITRKDLEPYFIHAANLLGLDGVPGPELPTSDPPELGFLGPRFKPRAFRIAPVRFAKRFDGILSRAPNVTALTAAPVLRLHMNDARTRVGRVSVQRPPSGEFHVEAGHFVLAAGGVENPRLLLLNGIAGRRETVGRYFMSHPALVNQQLHLDGAHAAAVEYCQQFNEPRGLVKLALDAAEQRRLRIANIHLRLRKPARIDPRHHPPTLLSRAMELKGLLGVQVGLHAEQFPDPDNRVRLGEETDPLGQRRVHIHWIRGRESETAVRRTVELFGREIGALGAGRYLMSPGGREDWAVTPAHQLGATRMHDDPGKGAVDRDCRVHGVANLYVAGGSVFTTSGAANPTFTIIALALRLADHLAKKMGAA